MESIKEIFSIFNPRLSENEQEVLDNLNLKDRAYSLLYALGQEPETVQPLFEDEARRLVTIAQEVYAGTGETYFHKLIAQIPIEKLRYVATGR